ncbi:MAG: hypothetical protein NTW03_19600 [Verrucomicrobia bacterium]|nr:hypothetical protein [Verrucomicrobiota bacterium]
MRKTDPALVHYELARSLPSPHAEPNRITFGPDGKLWVTAGKNVAALDKEGAKALEWTADQEITCLGMAADGVVHLGLRDHIELFKNNQRLARWASPAKKAWLTGLAVGEKDVFATDAGNRTVYHFDRSGKLLGRIGDKDKARAIPAFSVPSPYFDLEIGGDGLLWVANPGLLQLQAFTFDGALRKKWGEPSFGIAGFCGCCNPSYFTRLPDGRFVTSEKGLNRIKVYSEEGKFESVVAGADSFPQYAEKITADALPTAVDTARGSPASLAWCAQGAIPMDVAADAGGQVYVADTLGNAIRIYRRKAKI